MVDSGPPADQDESTGILVVGVKNQSGRSKADWWRMRGVDANERLLDGRGGGEWATSGEARCQMRRGQLAYFQLGQIAY